MCLCSNSSYMLFVEQGRQPEGNRWRLDRALGGFGRGLCTIAASTVPSTPVCTSLSSAVPASASLRWSRNQLGRIGSSALLSTSVARCTIRGSDKQWERRESDDPHCSVSLSSTRYPTISTSNRGVSGQGERGEPISWVRASVC
jgi:hypothetical protein